MSSAIQIRKYRQKTQDLAEMVRIKNERSIAMDEPPSSTEERLLRSFEQYIFGMEIERDVFLAWRETQCLGFGFCMMNGAYNTGYIDTNIAPAAVLSEVFHPLFATGEQHIRQTLGVINCLAKNHFSSIPSPRPIPWMSKKSACSKIWDISRCVASTTCSSDSSRT